MKRGSEKSYSLWQRFCEHNAMGILAKWILSDGDMRSAQLKSFTMVFQDGVEFKVDATTSKAFKRFKHKIKHKAKNQPTEARGGE